MALHLSVRHGLADLLGDAAKSVDDLSACTGLPAESLRRLLRALSYTGVFAERPDGLFSNNPVSDCLRADADPSLREMTLILNDEAVLRGWDQLERVLETGKPAFEAVNGTTFFQHVSADPKRSENMARFMKGIYGPEGPKIAAGFPFGRFAKLIDVGAGPGHILADILRAHRGVEGAVFELPATANVARQFLAGQGLADRVQVFAGDFREAVTPGYDAYFIKSTLHDWDDTASVRILSKIREAMPAHGRVLVTEIILEPGKPVGHPHRFIDLEMMVTFGGKERTADDFRRLLEGAGLRFEGLHGIAGSFFSIVEGSKGSTG
jgi:multifunctional cyclase/dehydratase/O-methyltransferase